MRVGGAAKFSGNVFAYGGTDADVSDPAVGMSNNRTISWKDSTGAFANCGFVWFSSVNELNLGAGNITRLSIAQNGVSTFYGSAPGTAGSNQVLIGGGHIKTSGDINTSGSVNVDGGQYVYLRGDASTDGSCRISSPSSGNVTVEIRKSGTWTEMQRWA
jgi:hypothetical protein